MKNNEMMNEPVMPVEETKEMMMVPAEVPGAAMTFTLDMLTAADNQFYCSIPDDGTRKSKIDIYNAISNAEYKLDDFINKELKIRDVVVHPVEIVDEKTGEVSNMLRTILIDTQGKGYAAVSYGVLSSLQRMFYIVGKPSWKDEPLTILVKKETTRNGNKVTTLTLVG